MCNGGYEEKGGDGRNDWVYGGTEFCVTWGQDAEGETCDWEERDKRYGGLGRYLREIVLDVCEEVVNRPIRDDLG